MINTCRRKEYIYYFVLAVLGFIFFCCVGQNGYILFSDSLNYLEPTEFLHERYKLYPFLLNLFKVVFGTELYLNAVFWFQSFLAFFVSWISTEYFRKRFNISYLGSVFVYACLFLPYGYSLPENVATHHILTEGLSFSLFHIFLLCIIVAVLDKKMYMWADSFILLILLYTIRSQLLLFCIPYVIVFLNFFVCKVLGENQKQTAKKIRNVCFGICGIGILSLPIFFSIILHSNGLEQFKHAIVGRALCIIDENDYLYVDNEYQDFTQFLYEKIDDMGYRDEYFNEGLWCWEDVVNSTNENTKNAWKWVTEYSDHKNVLATPLGNAPEEIASVLLHNHIDKYWKLTFYLCIQSLVVSIFINPDKILVLCHVIALLIYLCSFAIVVKHKIDNKDVCRRKVFYIVILFLFSNAFITNIFFYGLQRYVVYTFGYFYLSIFLLLRDLLSKK